MSLPCRTPIAATSCRKRTRAAFMSPPAVVRVTRAEEDDVLIPPTDDEEEEEEEEEVERCVRPKFDLPLSSPTAAAPAPASHIRVEVPHAGLSLAVPLGDLRRADGSIHAVFTVSRQGNLCSVSIDT